MNATRHPVHLFALICVSLAGPQTTWAAGQARAIALTSGKSISQSPRISPEGMRIVYVRDSNLWIMNDAGGGRNQLTHFTVVKRLPSGAQHPSWSPDGKRIVFRGIPTERRGGIFVVNADGSNLKQLTTNWLDDEPDWSPDGHHIVFTSRPHLWVMEPDGQNAHPLTLGNLGDAVEFSPRWSPKGDQIAYLLGGSGVPKIRMIGANGENPRSLDVDSYNLAWSRDGKFLYFQYGSPLKTISAQDGTAIQTILDWNRGYENVFDVSPDEKWMVSDFACEDGPCPGSGQIYKLHLP